MGSETGEQMVLAKPLVVEAIMPASVLRELRPEEMLQAYRTSGFPAATQPVVPLSNS